MVRELLLRWIAKIHFFNCALTDRDCRQSLPKSLKMRRNCNHQVYMVGSLLFSLIWYLYLRNIKTAIMILIAIKNAPRTGKRLPLVSAKFDHNARNRYVKNSDRRPETIRPSTLLFK